MQDNIYPTLKVSINTNPNRFYAVPLIGMLVKIIILIPQYIEMLVLMIVVAVMLIINSFVVLFTGKYWQTAYRYILGYMRFYTKISFFMSGLTDKYPGFDLNIHDNYSLDMPYPQSPNRLYAVPFLGGLIRWILIIPFYIFWYVIYYAGMIALFIYAWFSVLFMGKYPESAFELERDGMRLILSLTAYTSGLSDKYPSFSISWNHKAVKIILIILAVILIISGFFNNSSTSRQQNTYQSPNINIQNNIYNY